MADEYYDRIADLSLQIDRETRTRHERDTSSGFTRVSTGFELHGAGATGRGEDVTYDTEDHDALADASSLVPPGEYTFAEFSATLDDVDLFPTDPPERESSRHYRRWAVESAALDLALKQAGTTLGAVVGRSYDPVRFVVSTRLGDPPTIGRVETLLDHDPEVEIKLDPTSDWDGDLVNALTTTGVVRILDLKGHYEGTEVDQPPDPDLYERVLSAFPNAVVEDPALTAETEALFEDERHRVSWDAPITGVESVEMLPFEPQWLNVKPSRFGTVASLFETITHCEERDVQLYGGGQFELGVGRGQIQALASLFYPDGPNDVAPGGYNDPDLPDGLPTSPLEASAFAPGFGV
jgi:hypothetical protein